MPKLAPLTFHLGLAVLVTFPCTAQDGPAAVDQPQPKSPSVAHALSIGGTLLPTVLGYGLVTTGAEKRSELALLIFGVYVGPALGHFYANQPRPGLRGIATRAAILGVSFLALTQTGLCLEYCESGEEIGGHTVILVGLALTATSAVYDMVTAGRSARRYNASSTSVSVVPLWSPSQRSAGLGVTIVF